MPNFICTTCGVQYGESLSPPASCVICSEERQYAGWQGQQWTTLEGLRSDHRSSVLEVGGQAMRYSARRYLRAIGHRDGE